MEKQFLDRFHDFRKFGDLFLFLIKPESCSNVDLDILSWLEINDFPLQMIEFKTSSLCLEQFSDLRKSLLLNKKHKGNLILACWESIPEKFSSLKKIAIALLTVFGSTYKCEQIFSIMKFVLNGYRSRLTPVHSEACIKIKATCFDIDVESIASKIQPQGSH